MGVGSGGKTVRFGGAAWRGAKAHGLKIEFADEQVDEPDLEGILALRSQTDMPAGERRADEELMPLVGDDPGGNHSARQITGAIAELWAILGQRAGRAAQPDGVGP
ncbi:MAG: hypothetical protein RL479_540 [Verrucomicrobiota bacterium]